MATIAKQTPETKSSATPAWLQWLDDRCERFGDAMNPILVKETRQALKSRQFIVTFSVLLFAALAWTIAGSLSMIQQIYTTPSAPRMLIGYYIALALPLLLVVPLAAYRSLEGEIDDGTLELLSITTLSPWQIVLGKLASALLQMLLYFVALFPCVAYAYTLRGVDLPTVLLIMGTLAASALFLTIVGLFFAPLAMSRTGRIGTLLALMVILLAAEYSIGYWVINLILNGNPLDPSFMFFLICAVLAVGTAAGNLLLVATAAQLTPPSENRSTPLRLSLLFLTAVILAVSTYGFHVSDSRYGESIFGIAAMALAIVWTFGSSLIVAESPVMTPRIRRELPSSFLARTTLTWLTPGPDTGLVFCAVSVATIGVAATFGFDYLLDLTPSGARMRRAGAVGQLTQFIILFASYLVCFLVAVRWVVAVVRINNNPSVQIGFAALVVVALVSALVPYSVELHFNDYRPFAYSGTQITNWAWTLIQSSSGRLASGEEYWVMSAAITMFLMCLLTMPMTVLPRRIATPERVLKERAEES